MPVKINPGGTAIAISSADFHKITPSDMKIDRGEILYYREEAAETFPPLENIAFLTVENGGENNNIEYWMRIGKYCLEKIFFQSYLS